MSEPVLISPLLDDYIMGGPISDHHGVCCCPAMKKDTDERYIVKVISVPASPSKIDALLLTGAYPDEASVLRYFEEIANGIVEEIHILDVLSEQEGFLPYSAYQVAPMESGKGLDIYTLSPYQRTLEKHFKRHPLTHLDVLNLGLDLCAALAVARRSGYLYVDLKPSNVYVIDQRLYRIGDIGFVRLDSLKYASLPDRYISEYTAPEAADAFSALNATMDVYAAGLILYQAYNNGILPFSEDVHPGDTLPAPMYADYEMTEIILKACNPDPAQRWEDPMQMGQAIVSYMQRNGANDTPVVPVSKPEVDEPAQTEEIANAAEEIAEEVAVDAIINEESENKDDSEYVESAYVPDPELEAISLLVNDQGDEDILSEADNLNDITDEVSEMLQQADDLAAAEVPEPVIVPEHIDLPEPEPVAEDEEIIDQKPDDSELPEDSEFSENQDSEDKIPADEIENSEVPESTAAPKKKHLWLLFITIALVLAGLVASIFLFYKHYYLLPVNSLYVQGNEDSLIVFVDTDIDESLLLVVCYDTYGNQIPAPVLNGRAIFSDLVPNTAYNIKVVANGFHKLTGDFTTAYSTPIQTNIVQFDAVTGNSDGSVILSFSVEGPDCDEWTVYYSTRGEEERSATFTSHMVTLTDLTVGSEYVFRLVPKQSLYITGQDKIAFTPRTIVKAENVEVISCVNNTLTVQWTVHDGEEVTSWAVYCYNDAYKQTIITSDTFATFTDLDHTAEYTVEVKAAGMSVSEKTTVGANSITASNFKVDTSNPRALMLSWAPSQPIPADGWVLRYSIAGYGTEMTIPCNDNAITIFPVVPNATYTLRLENTAGNVLLGSNAVITTGAPVDFNQQFDGFVAARENLAFSMCKRPAWTNWDRYDLRSSDYTTTFAVDEKASFLVHFDKRYASTTEPVVTTYVIRNSANEPFMISHSNSTWLDMWYKNYCELDIPVMPTQAGSYTMEVYFNGGLVAVQPFTII